MQALGKPRPDSPKHDAGGCPSCPTRHLCAAAELEEDALSLSAACVRISMPMDKGEHLYWEGDRADRCFIVRSGVYKSSTVRSCGDEYTTGFYFPEI